MTTLTIVRGLPGSGKTAYAKEFVKNSGGKTVHFEADQYFVDEEGEYTFRADELLMAHKFCRRLTSAALRMGWSVVVSNTFTQAWEVAPYRRMAGKYGADVHVVTCGGDYGSVHDVPEAAIEKMRARWEEEV